MMFRIKLIAVLLSLLSFTNVSAQLKANNNTLRGRVIDAKTKSHLPYAIIRIKNTGSYVMSNANGDFEMPIPKMYWPKKRIVFEAKANAYRSTFFEIKTKKQQKNDVLILKMKSISAK